MDEQRRFCIAYPEVKEDACGIGEDVGHIATVVKIALRCPTLPDKREEAYPTGIMHISDPAQRQLSDLCRKPSVG
jgi:hypothetical protein